MGLSPEWIITPVGGADKVPTFVALIGAQTNLNLAVLIDYQKRDHQKIENLFKRKLLSKRHILTYADYTSGDEADIEDIFDPKFYLKLVNGAFESSIVLDDLSGQHPRILRCLDQYLEQNPLPKSAKFNHYRPARYFNNNIGQLASEISEQECDRFQKVFDALNKLL